MRKNVKNLNVTSLLGTIVVDHIGPTRGKVLTVLHN